MGLRIRQARRDYNALDRRVKVFCETRARLVCYNIRRRAWTDTKMPMTRNETGERDERMSPHLPSAQGRPGWLAKGTAI